MAGRYRTYSRDQLPKRPEIGVYDSGSRDDLSGSTLGQLTPSRLGQVLRDAEGGDIASQAEVFDKIEQDPHVMAVYGKRKRACLTRKMSLAPADDTPRAQAAVELCEEMIQGIQGWRPSLFDLLDAIGRAFAACQIIWARRDGQFKVERLRWWRQRDFVLDPDDPDQVRVVTSGSFSKGEPLLPGQWIVHSYKARTGTLADASLFRGLAWAYLFKHFSWRDWVIFSEAYGMPRRVVTYPRGASDEEKRQGWVAARLLGKDGAAAIPEGMKLEFLKADAATPSLPFPDLITLSDRYISKLLLGQTMTTEEGDKGARSLGEVHKEVQDELVESDLLSLSETLRDQLLTPIVRFNLGDAPVPLVSFPAEEATDLLKRAQQLQIVGGMGMPMSKQQLREEFRIEEPRDDEDALVAKPSASADPMAPMRMREDTDRLARIERLLELAAEKKRPMTWEL